MNFCEAIGCTIRNVFTLDMAHDEYTCRIIVTPPARAAGACSDWSSGDWDCRYLYKSGKIRETNRSLLFSSEDVRSEIQIVAALTKSANG